MPAPYVVGIHGDWGAGKTSFLHQLHCYLTGQDRCPQSGLGTFDVLDCPRPEVRDNLAVIWFEAWRYQHEAAPIVALLREIRAQLPLACKALNQTKKLGEIAIRTSLLSLDELAKKIGLGGFSTIARTAQEQGEAWEDRHLATTLPSHAVREFLNHHLQQLLRGGVSPKKNDKATSPRVVVLIDDLDRCEPEGAFRLLEGIKIYLNLESCVFVLGMNPSHMERAIAKQLKDAASGEDPIVIAREYLEKLCQESWHLPNVIQPGSFLKHWLPEGKEPWYSIAKVVESHRGCLPANPRKLKAASNVIGRLIRQVGAVEGDNDDREKHARLVLIFASLYQFHPDLHRMIEAYEAEFYNNKLLTWSRAESIAPGPMGEADDEHRLLKGLERMQVMPAGAADRQQSESTPPRSPSLRPAYPDPVRGNVLRVQSLIGEVGQLTDHEIKKYLLR